ncbi:F-box/kelch-repeat protein At3g23880-like [Vicia villosa]|uniref:F-box/kelch-repeat protein At3g23880-like n=1 Tax=Vicia villosa TaxID=3911 RepID=UPI00273CDC73|nr:F-box/kelch-repeat protein At3g23880-like [Vicia villosa]
MTLCRLTSKETLTSPPPTFDSLSTLPRDLIVEILCRLPVKFLLQFQSVCKLWNSLISDLKFAKKHLHLSTTRGLNSVCYIDTLSRYIFEYRPPDSLFSIYYMDVTQIEYPPNGFDRGYYQPDSTYYIVGSCNGILCLALDHEADLKDCFVLVWNPSIRKFKELSIGEFPFSCAPFGPSGTFVCGAINWLASKSWHRKTPCLIVSFDLKNESFQEILQPDYGEVDASSLSLGVLRDCLCMISGYAVLWVMKEYGNKESWTKLLTISYRPKPYSSNFLTKLMVKFEKL